MKTFKRLPYGESNFERLIDENYAYVDKTRYIEMLENENNTRQFFIRPRKFGKSLFFSMLSCYYDMKRVDRFEDLFGGLYIGKNPTPRKNSYAVMEFNFSGIDTSSPENFIISFKGKVQLLVQRFLKKYETFFEKTETLIDNIEKNQYKITFEVDAQEFAKGINQSYNKNKGHINIPGFRKGKAPRQIIEMHHGADVFFQDAFDFVLPEAYGKAAEESGLEIVARPEIDVLEASTDKGVVFAATVYTRPEVGLSSYKGLKYEPVPTFINDDEITAELAKLQDKNSRIITVSDRPIANDDIVILDFEGFVDGVPFEGGKAEDFELVIGSKMFIDTFEEQLVGMSVGDSKQVNVTFPEEYHAEALKGKPAMFEVTIKEIKTKEMPELDNDFAADVSEFETIEELKESIRTRLLEAKEAQAKNAKEQALVDQLIEATQIDVPDVMVEERVDQMLRDMANDMSQRGIDMESYFQYTGTNIDMLRDNYRNHADKHVRARLALTEIAKLEGFEASEEDIDAEFDKISAAYNIPKEQLMTIMADKEKKDLAKDIVVRKALELLVDSAVAQ